MFFPLIFPLFGYSLSLCDLAGQERGKKTQNTRERLREAGKIHGSLLALSQCLVAIRSNQKKKYVYLILRD